MIVRRWTVLLGVCALFLFVPGQASAGLLGWLEALSGPGPWKGRALVSMPIYCSPAETVSVARKENLHNKWYACGYGAEERKFYIEAELGWWTPGPRAEFDGNIYLRTYRVMAYTPLGEVFCRSCLGVAGRAIDVGAGIGLFHFTGAGVFQGDTWRPTIPLRVRITPLELVPKHCVRNEHVQRLLDSVYVTAGLEILPHSYGFNKQGVQNVRFGNEDLGTVGLALDLGRLGRGVIGLFGR